jgi:hypothetical protein
MKCQIEISHNKVAELVSVYGFPHLPNNRKCQRLDEGNENDQKSTSDNNPKNTKKW